MLNAVVSFYAWGFHLLIGKKKKEKVEEGEKKLYQPAGIDPLTDGLAADSKHVGANGGSYFRKFEKSKLLVADC